jgi:hypothetical protein
MRPPTDLEIFDKIYSCYYSDFAKFKKGDRVTKFYVPIDVDLIGDALGVDGDIIFGRLHYHCNHRYNFTQRDGTVVNFFENSLEGNGKKELHSVRFELMASVLAELLDERSKRRFANTVAVGSFIVSVVALLVAIFK